MRGPNRDREGPHGQAVGVPGPRVPGGGTPLLGWLALRPRVCAPLPALPSRGAEAVPPTLGHMLGTHRKAQRRAVQRVRSSRWFGRLPLVKSATGIYSLLLFYRL
jgi:hypothetical protein